MKFNIYCRNISTELNHKNNSIIFSMLSFTFQASYRFRLNEKTGFYL